MEDIKIGEYVRTSKGIIGKLINKYTFENGQVTYPEPQEWVIENKHFRKDKYIINEADCDFDNIVKHSPDIIDLIEEEGDYVNGKRVVYIDTIEDGDGNKRLCVFVEETQDCIEQNEIKSIVTKEQFKSVEYEV